METNTIHLKHKALYYDIVINIAVLIIFYLIGLLILPFAMKEGSPGSMHKVYTIVTPGSFSLIMWFVFRLSVLVVFKNSIGMKLFNIAYLKKGNQILVLDVLKYEIGNFFLVGSLIMFNQANNVNICCGMLSTKQFMSMFFIFIGIVLICFFGVIRVRNLEVYSIKLAQASPPLSK